MIFIYFFQLTGKPQLPMNTKKKKNANRTMLIATKILKNKKWLRTKKRFLKENAENNLSFFPKKIKFIC